MYKQGDQFTDEEKAWLQKRYADDDVQKIYQKGGHYHLDSADLLLGEYYEKSGQARPAENRGIHSSDSKAIRPPIRANGSTLPLGAGLNRWLESASNRYYELP